MDLEAQVANFKETGYLVLPGLLPGTLVERLAREVDEWVDSGLRQLSIDACLRPEECAPPSVVELRMEAHGELAAYAPCWNCSVTTACWGRPSSSTTCTATAARPEAAARTGTTTTSSGRNGTEISP